MKHLFSAALCLLIALSAPAASAQQKMTFAESKAALKELENNTCKHFQLFASKEEASPLVWVGTLDEKECHAKFAERPAGSAKTYLDAYFTQPHIAEGIKQLCAENKDYASPEKCIADMKSDELTSANAQLYLYNTAFGRVQHICSDAIKQKTGDTYHAAAGICAPLPLPDEKSAEWKGLWEQVYQGMNTLLEAPEAERCLSFKGSAERFPVLSRLQSLFPLQSDHKQALTELSSLGFICVKDAKDSALNRCGKTFSGFRFISNPQIPGGLETFSGSDTLEITLRNDNGKTADVCTNIINMGL